MTTQVDLERLFNKYRYDANIVIKSKTWFQQQVTLMTNRRVNERLLFKEQKLTSKIIPGKLYMFYYDPKTKDKLPYYDTFPLVFPYDALNDGFIGLNMHYLPYWHRIQLMTRLMKFASNTTLDTNTKIRYSWSLIAGVSRFKVAESCIKRYLSSHVESQFIEVPANDWHTAMMLPVERFHKSNKNAIWGDSISL
jgi:hypothetical protein